jgi:Fic family protein
MNIAEKLRLADDLKAKIDKLTPQQNWDDAFYKKVKIDFTYNSNKLEGSSLTYGQTIQLLRDFVTPKNTTPGELLDMINHQKILDIVFANYRSQSLSEENIRSLHRELMKNRDQWSYEGEFNPGQYKSFENYTVRASGKIHAYMLPNQVAKAMGDLVTYTNIKLAESGNDGIVERHPLFIATYFHRQFLNEIHPFSDGNGRIGRIFMNLILIRKGYPPIFIKEVNRNEYLKCFELSDDDISPMLDFMADRLKESLEEKFEFIKTQTRL